MPFRLLLLNKFSNKACGAHVQPTATLKDPRFGFPADQSLYRLLLLSFVKIKIPTPKPARMTTASIKANPKSHYPFSDPSVGVWWLKESRSTWRLMKFHLWSYAVQVPGTSFGKLTWFNTNCFCQACAYRLIKRTPYIYHLRKRVCIDSSQPM